MKEIIKKEERKEFDELGSVTGKCSIKTKEVGSNSTAEQMQTFFPGLGVVVPWYSWLLMLTVQGM